MFHRALCGREIRSGGCWSSAARRGVTIISMYVYMYIYIYIYNSVCVHTYAYTYIYIYIYDRHICIYVYIHIYVLTVAQLRMRLLRLAKIMDEVRVQFGIRYFTTDPATGNDPVLVSQHSLLLPPRRSVRAVA